jgi:tripartite-type tricarboxylate transporter receptor subunit TctC
MFERIVTLCAGVLLAFASVVQAAQRDAAAAFPNRPVRLIVANTAGGASDVVARLVAVRLSEIWGQQVVVDNRPGATGLIAAETTARAAPDGYTLWLNSMTQLIATLQAQRYPVAKDFAPITLVGSTPFVIVVGPAVPAKNLAEYIAYAKARPGQLTYGSSGQWGSSHLCSLLLDEMTGMKHLHVPYKGSTLVVQDLMAGTIHSYCSGAPTIPQFTGTGKIRTLAQTYMRPTPLAPGVPPVSDTVPGFEMLGWYGVVAPLAMQKALVSRINADFVRVLKMQDLRDQLFKVGAEAVGSTPEEFGALLKRDHDRWEKLLRSRGAIGTARG